MFTKQEWVLIEYALRELRAQDLYAPVELPQGTSMGDLERTIRRVEEARKHG